VIWRRTVLAIAPAPDPIHNLDDETVKLVAYTIVSVKRDEEKVMPQSGDSIVITERMSEQTFIAFVIARYMQSDYYRNLPPGEKLAPQDQKYLRVDYTVAHRWPLQPREFEQRQIETLQEIKVALEEI
jgi:hypothetical protein